MLESAYEACLMFELLDLNLCVERQKPLRLSIAANPGLRLSLDLLIENAIIVDVKSIERLAPVHSAQLLSYLRQLKLKLGLLINSM